MAKYDELDYAQSVARIRSLETRLLGMAGYERLLSAASAEDAVKALAEFGWKQDASPEEMFRNELFETFRLVKELDGGEFLLTQRLKYDYHNLKLLIKCDLTRQDGDSLLSDNGTIPVVTVKSAVQSRDYRALTAHMRRVIPEAYEQYVRVADARLVDMILDAGYFSDLCEYASRIPEPETAELIKVQIDIYNITSFVRIRTLAMRTLMEKVIQSGGTIPKKFFISNADSEMPDGAIFASTAYASAFEANMNLERTLENIFLEKIRAVRRRPFGLAPVAAYFWVRENDVRNARIIITCKRAGINNEEIIDRIRGR